MQTLPFLRITGFFVFSKKCLLIIGGYLCGILLLPELVFAPEPVVVPVVKSQLFANLQVSRREEAQPSIREALPHLSQGRGPAVVDVAAQIRLLRIHGVDPRLVKTKWPPQPEQVPRLDQVPVALVDRVVVHRFAQIVHDELALFYPSPREEALAFPGRLLY